MFDNKYVLTGILLSASTAVASSMNSFTKRDGPNTWGAAFSLGPSKSQEGIQTIIQTTTTVYPGKMPTNQQAFLYTWLGISNGTGDLIQSVVGSYPAGDSQCFGQNGADTTWCVISGVYASGRQWIGDFKTADLNYENGILLNYTLVDEKTYLWTQTMSDAVTGALLSSYNKTSGPMTGWGTALECNHKGDKPCTGTDQHQYYVDSTIILKEADPDFIHTLGSGVGVEHTDMTTTDGGKTWKIAKIAIPPMVQNAATQEEVTPAAVAGTAAATATSAKPTAIVKSSSSSAMDSAKDVEDTIPSSCSSVVKGDPTTAASSTLATSKKPAAATTAAAASSGSVQLYGNCSGGKTCAEGSCEKQNEYYSQCL